MINLAKTFDDSFKKDVNALITKGLIDMKKAMPKGSVYTSSKKPPKGAQVFRTARGTEYWVPSKKDKEDSKAGQAKPKSDISAAKIDKLRWQYANVPDRLSSYETGKIREKMIKEFDKKQLEVIATSDIKWLSSIAAQRLIDKGATAKEIKALKESAKKPKKTIYEGFHATEEED